MGLTKQYLAYRVKNIFNIIASGRSNANFVIYNNTEGRYVAVAAAENVFIWDLRLGERVLSLKRGKEEVSALRISPDRIHIAVGYVDGVVEIFDLSNPQQSVCSLALHKNAISVLRYDDQGIRLVCGSLDTEMVIIDAVVQAGCQRLVGHSGPITDAHFVHHLDMDNIVVSSSKDTQIKFWNLDTNACFKTIVDNRTEVWSLALLGDLMIAGCGESTMNVYRLKKHDTANAKPFLESGLENLSIDDADTLSPIKVSSCGCIQRIGKGRCVSLVADPSQRVVSCHGINGVIENFYICSEAEAKERLTKRLKKAKKNQQKTETTNEENQQLATDLALADEIKRLDSVKVKHKIKSIDVLLGVGSELRILVVLANNTIELHSLPDISSSKNSNENENSTLLRSIARHGHQSEVRSLCVSSDSNAIGSGSGESFKIWIRETAECLRTITTDYILCSIFTPADRYAVLGTKSGKLIIVDAGSADIVEEIQAHDSEVWSIALLPDQKGCVTGSGDTTVKFWTFALLDSAEEVADANSYGINAKKVLSLIHKSTLKLEETILCLQVSCDMKYIAVGLLDSTVKVFFLDTFKFYLSLYGHKLPVMCMDISDDSTLIATGSADRNVKIWGLDFGDCHRSLFAHDDSVMALKFIPGTHMFFTCGKDGSVKQWDGDIFKKIISLPGHIGEAYNLAISPNGLYLITCGSDRTIRMYERTDEVIVLQDIEEEEREEIENQQLATGEANSIPLLPGLKLPSRKTVGAEKAAESILECLEICQQHAGETPEKIKTHPLMRALEVQTLNEFILVTLSRIRSSDLEEALLILPFSNVCELLHHLPNLVEENPHEIEIICKVVTFLFKVHMKPIAGAKHMKAVLQKLITLLKRDVTSLRDAIGFNLHSLALLQHQIEQNEGVQLFHEAAQKRKQNDKKRRHREILKRQFIQMA